MKNISQKTILATKIPYLEDVSNSGQFADALTPLAPPLWTQHVLPRRCGFSRASLSTLCSRVSGARRTPAADRGAGYRVTAMIGTEAPVQEKIVAFLAGIG